MAEQTYRVEMKNINKSLAALKLSTMFNSQLNLRDTCLNGRERSREINFDEDIVWCYSEGLRSSLLDGCEIFVKSPKEANDLGISIYQEFALVPHLTVAENIFIDRLSEDNKGFISWKNYVVQQGIIR